jgi:predicted alpha/beta-fold hydrolase
MLHGLGGCSESSYLQRLTAKLNGLGFTVLRVNHRGCGRGAEGLAKQIYHAGRSEDLGATLDFLARRWPGRPYFVTAFSLSANILLRYLGTIGDGKPLFKKALAVCPPVDLELCSQALATPGNWHIDRYYTRLMLATARDRARIHAHLKMPAMAPRRMNLRVFDEVYTAPLGGFGSREAYYDQSSAKHVMDRVRVPTTILAAADDPIIPAVSFAGVKFSPAVAMRMEDAGGHMGFISRESTRFGDRRWMDAAVVDWVEA